MSGHKSSFRFPVAYCFLVTLFALLCLAPEAKTQPATRAEVIVSPAWVRDLTDFHQPGGRAPRPPGYSGNRYVIIETSWDEKGKIKDYLAGHIPGAIHLNTDELENGYPRWRLRSVRELSRVIGAHGITSETTVVVYGKQLTAAARVWWILSYAGVADVRLLNGGLAAWMAAGYPVETGINTPQRVKFTARPRAQWLATTEYVGARSRDRQAILADARSREEYVGEISGYDYMDFKGRIPGAVAIGNADDEARAYASADGSLRDLAEVRALWEQMGIVNDQREVIFYCGSGWRSSLTFLYAWALGFDRIRNYSDGWAGWSTVYLRDRRARGGTPGWRQRRTTRPVATGLR